MIAGWKQRKLWMWLLGTLILLAPFQLSGSLPAYSQNTPAYVRLARRIDTERLGARRPLGLAFAADTGTFVVLSQGPADASQFTLLEDTAGTIDLAGVANDRSNLTFDRMRGRLILFDAAGNQLTTVPRGATGRFDKSGRRNHSLRTLGIGKLQGMAADPASGRLFLLDSNGHRLFVLTPNAQGELDADAAQREGRVARVALPRMGPGQVRSLAYDPQRRRLFVLNPRNTTLYEITEAGALVAERNLAAADIGLTDPQALVVAPSGDSTDDPAATSVYVVDSRQGDTLQRGGQVLELALDAPLAVAATTETAVLLNTILTSQWSPASPDPMGLGYSPALGRLVEVDSEVEEMAIFAQKNVFVATTAGSLTASHSTIAFSDEPTGMAFNNLNRYMFISDDDADEVYIINPGGDNQYFTGDDVRTSFDTRAINNMDAEGAAFDSANGILYLADGLNSEVYRIHPGPNGVFQGIAAGSDDVITHFDVAVLGMPDPEGIEFSPTTGTLYLTGAGNVKRAIEITTAGVLLRTIDMAIFSRSPSGLAIGPSTANPAVTSLYVADRGRDNDSDPNENDGKIYEIALNEGPATPTNTPTNTPVDPTNTPTNTPVDPTNTPTNTPVDPTNTPTNTPVGPTDTPTNTPTNTPVGPTDTPTSTPLPSAVSFYLSLSGSATLNGISVRDEDIVGFNNGTFSMLFDGSDVGVTGDVNAFTFLDADTILFSLDAAATLGGLGAVDDSDIIRFDATSLGANTAGTLSLYFDGSNVGLDTDSEDIDSFELLADGRLLISTSGSATAPGVSSADEDVLAFTPTALGTATSGSWAMYFDGSDVGLSTNSDEDVDALAIAANGDLYLSTTGNFDVTTVAGADEDVFICQPITLGSTTACTYQAALYFDGSALGLAANDIDAIDLP